MKRITTLILIGFIAIISLNSCDTSDCKVQEVVVGYIPSAAVGNYFEHTLAYKRTCAPKYEQWYLLGGLPPGLQFASNGVISGRPTRGGDYDITVEIECFFDEEYDEWDNPIYTNRSAVTATFTISVLDSIVR